MVTGSDELLCFLEHNPPTAGYNNLLPTGQQPMGTGRRSEKWPAVLPITGEQRLDTGGRASGQGDEAAGR
jgi:hypothetical protein